MKNLIFFLTVLIIFFALNKEKKNATFSASPLSLVVTSNIVVLVLYYITSDFLGFHSLSFDTFVVLLYGCIFFAIVSLLYSSNITVKTSSNSNRELRFVEVYPNKMIVVLAFITIAFMGLKIQTLGLNNIFEDDDSAMLFGASGLSGHILVLQVLLATHLIGRKLTLLSSIAVLGLVFCLFVYNVKAWVIIPFLLGFFIRKDLLGMKINLIAIFFAIVGIFVLFTISYLIQLGWDFEHMDFIWAHFCKYIFAGIGGLNEALTQRYPIGNAPFYGTPTFVSLILPVKIIVPSEYDYVIINDLNGEYTNVYSLFGGAYLFNGPVIGGIYLLLLAVISNVLYRKSQRTDNYWFCLSYYMWSSGLILSFFSNYYTLLNIWELTAVAFLIGLYYQRRCPQQITQEIK